MIDARGVSEPLTCEGETIVVNLHGQTRPYWFDPGEQPEDAWEKTREGKEALERAEKRCKWQAEYGESRRTKKQGAEPQSSAQA